MELIGKYFVYKTPYGGVTVGKIKEVRGYWERKPPEKEYVDFILSENNNAYKLNEIIIQYENI